MMKSTGRYALTADQVAAYVDSASEVLKLPVPGAYRAGVITNLERLLQLGELVMSFPLPEDIEVAPVFRP